MHRSFLFSKPNTARRSRARSMLLALVLLAGGLSMAAVLVPTSVAIAANTALAQCNNVGPGPGGATTAMTCDITVVNTISGGVSSSTTTVTRLCALDPCAPGNGTFSSASSDLVTDISQCNDSDNDAAHPITCTVHVTNNVSADTPGAAPLTSATVNQCVGTATGGGSFGGLGPLVCNPFPATTSGAVVTQCNGSVTGGGSTAVCSVDSASLVTPAIPVTVNQCNRSGNAGGTLLTCAVSVTSVLTAAVVVVPSPTPSASATSSPSPTPTATSSPSPAPSSGSSSSAGPTPSSDSTPTTSSRSQAAVPAPGVPVAAPPETKLPPHTPGRTTSVPQIPRVPSGGVGTGGGSTAGVSHHVLLILGCSLLLIAAVTGAAGRRNRIEH